MTWTCIQGLDPVTGEREREREREKLKCNPPTMYVLSLSEGEIKPAKSRLISEGRRDNFPRVIPGPSDTETETAD